MDKMTPKERLDAVVKGKLPDRVPVHDVSCIVISKAMGYEWKDLRYDAKRSAEAALKYNEITKSDYCFGILETPSMFMDLGMKVTQPDDNYGNVMSAYFQTPEDVDSKELYDPSDPKESQWVRKGIIDKIVKLREMNTSDVLTSGWSWGIITTAGFLRGVETLLMETMTEPELAHKVVKKAAKLVDGVMRAGCVGGDYIWLPDPTASGTVMNIDTFKEFCAGYTAEAVKGWKSEFNVPVIYHVCGDTIPIMEAIPSTDIDVLSVDRAVDLVQARKILRGDIALMGNVQPITLSSTDDSDFGRI